MTMAVTNYYSFGGEILGEETGGVRRDYLTDALGSVTATVTGSGIVENTYRYKPYGELLSKTGVGSDPKFLWVGAWGYFQNTNACYIRRRFLSSPIQHWMNRDPIGLNSGEVNYFIYSKNNPILFFDYSGLQIKGWLPKPPKNQIIYKQLENDCDSIFPPHGSTLCDWDSGNVVTAFCETIYTYKCHMFGCIWDHEDNHRTIQNFCCNAVFKCLHERKLGDVICKGRFKNFNDYNRNAAECSSFEVSSNCCDSHLKNCNISKNDNCDDKNYCDAQKKQRDDCCNPAPKTMKCPFDINGVPLPNFHEQPVPQFCLKSYDLPR